MVAAVVLARLAVSAAVATAGVRAISDDDFARVTIAQRFALAPSLDPSGTSWLPAPFWMTGSVMALFGRSLEVARVTAWVAGTLAAVLVLLGAAWLTESRVAAAAGALLALVIPYAAWLGVATVPDYLTAALLVVAMASAATRCTRRRLVGATCAAVACLSRYEAWPVAAALALLWLLDAWRAWSRPGGSQAGSVLALLAPGVLAVAAPLGWLAHGLVHHNDAWFFVKRVTDYQRALGQDASPVLGAVEGVLGRLLMEPEVVAVFATSVVLGWRMKSGAFERFRRPMLLIGALLLFLAAAQARGSAPTHHAERALLSAWLFGAVFSAATLYAAWQRLAGRKRTLLVLLAAGSFGLGVGVRQLAIEREPFVDRTSEVAIGRHARALASLGKLVIDTPDYGFFAVMAAAGGPERAEPLDDRDPRHDRSSDPFASLDGLGRVLRARGATSLVTPIERAEVARDIGVERARTERFALIELRW